MAHSRSPRIIGAGRSGQRQARDNPDHGYQSQEPGKVDRKRRHDSASSIKEENVLAWFWLTAAAYYNNAHPARLIQDLPYHSNTRDPLVSLDH